MRERKYMVGQILRINVRDREASWEKVPGAWTHLGGRGLIAKILVDEVPAGCDPSGPDNVLIFAPGLLVGHRLSSCDRISIGGKSPLTGGVKEANAGGRTGYQLARLGVKALLLEGQPHENEWYVLHITPDGVEFAAAGQDPREPLGVVGLGVYEVAGKLVARYGKDIAAALIGPGGEMGLAAAGIQNLDKDQVPSRIAARGGLGAVMGSKRIKAIVIDARDGSEPPLVDEAGFRAARQRYTKALLAHPQTQTYADYGTAAMTNMSNNFGALPTGNFSKGQFESAEKISGERLREILLDREAPSETTHACMRGCAIQCSNVVGDEGGEVIVSPLEYETLGLLGSNLGVDNLDAVAEMNWVLNDLGLDTIEVGAALGVAAEAGLVSFGNADGFLSMIEEIGQGTPLGRLLGSGAAVTGKVLGVKRVPAVKGQAMSAYDPRAIKGTGVTYATSPQGADHTAGLTIRAEVDHTDPDGQADLSRDAQEKMAGYDTLGACIFSGFGFAKAPGVIRDLLNARYGWRVEEEILYALGKETLYWERRFNRQAGFGPQDDRLPQWMEREPLPPLDAVFDVPPSDLDEVFDDLEPPEEGGDLR